MKDWLYSLEPLVPLLESYNAPDSPAPGEPHRATFDLFTLAMKATPLGTLEIGSASEKPVIDVRIDRPGEGGFRALAEFRYHMEPDRWRIRSWSAHSWMAAESEPSVPYPHTAMRLAGRVAGRSVQITRGSSRHSLPLTGPLAGKWPLIETARQMAISKISETLHFACLDEGSAVFSSQTLQPGEWQIAPGGFELRPFLHTGTGQIPRVIWIDHAGRVIAFRSGTEAGVLTALNGKPGGYTEYRYDHRKFQLSLAE